MPNMKSVSNSVCNVKKSYSSFRAGSIKQHLHIWKQLTTDRNIIDVITGVKLDFIEQPMQTKAPCQTFNGKQTALQSFKRKLQY